VDPVGDADTLNLEAFHRHRAEYIDVEFSELDRWNGGIDAHRRHGAGLDESVLARRGRTMLSEGSYPPSGLAGISGSRSVPSASAIRLRTWK